MAKEVKKTPRLGIFQAHTKQQRLNRLAQRFSDKPFAESAKPIKTLAYSASFLFNLFSAMAALYGMTYITSFAFPNYTLALSISVLICIFLEVGKRYSSDAVWDKFHATKNISFSLLSLNFALLAISIGSSLIGIQQSIKDYAPPAKVVVNDGELDKLNNELTNIKNDISTQKATTWGGTITSDANRNITQLAKSQNSLLTAIATRTARLNSKNDNIESLHQMELSQVIFYALCLMFLIEVLFEICMSFCSYYDYRELVECIPNIDRVAQEILHNGYSIDNQNIAVPFSTNYAVPETVPTQKHNREIGFAHHWKTVPETVPIQPQNVVTQQNTIATEQKETVLKAVPKTVSNTENKTVPKQIVKVVRADISKYKNRCRLYYKRSINPKSKQSTRDNNRCTFLRWKELLYNAGIDAIEGKKELTFKKL